MLAVTVPTVRHMLEDGRLAGHTEANGSRFRWLVSRDSVEALRAKRDARDRARSGDRATVVQLRDEIAELRNELRALAPDCRPAGDLPIDAGALHEALLQQRALMDAWQAADLARAEVVRHLLDALAAGERADASRRDALAAANTIIGQFLLPVAPPM